MTKACRRLRQRRRFSFPKEIPLVSRLGLPEFEKFKQNGFSEGRPSWPRRKGIGHPGLAEPSEKPFCLNFSREGLSLGKPRDRFWKFFWASGSVLASGIRSCRRLGLTSGFLLL